MCQICTKFGGGRYRYEMLPLANLRFDWLRSMWSRRQPRDAIFIFIKHAIDRLSNDAMAELADRARGIIVDPVDRSLAAMPHKHIDIVLACSIAQHAALSETWPAQGPKVELLLHQADLRLYGLTAPPMDVFRPAYFGNPLNLSLPAPLSKEIPSIDVGLSGGMTAALPLFRQYNFHYGVRPQIQVGSDQVFKPLTKAITAAVLGAPIMINRDAHDAIALLGADYPYLVDSTGDADVIRMFEKAQTGFKGSEWALALDKMRSLGSRLSPARVAEDLEHILETLT